MSWDISILHAAKAPPPVEQMPDDWGGEPLGTPDEVRDMISKVLPSVDWADPTWGIYDGKGYSFEFNIGGDSVVQDMMIHVRGGGDAISDLLILCEAYHWYILDHSQGEWLHHCDDPHAGWNGFQAFRDRAFEQ